MNTVTKKFCSLLAFAFVFALAIGTADAQDPLWSYEPPQEWLGTGNTERGMTYNYATGNIIVASRNGGLKPVLLDGATGDSVGVLDVTGISGGILPINQIASTSDGQIFTSSLTVDGTGFKVYRWADETSTPELVFDGDIDAGVRTGDAIGAVGSADDVTVLASGSGSDVVVTFTWDGTDLTKTNEFPIEAGAARGGFSSHTYGDSVVVSGTGTAPRFINYLDGTVGSTLGSSTSVMANDYVEHAGINWFASGPAFGEFYVEMSNEDKTVEYTLNPFAGSENSNGNNTGGVAIDTENDRIFFLDTNKGLVGYSLDYFIQDFTYEEATIAEARSMDGQKVAITGIATTPNYGFNNGQWFLQDETAGINIIFFGEGGFEVNAGDEHVLYGEISSFNDQIQINVDSAELISQDNDLTVYEIGLDEFLNVDSEFQGSYVLLDQPATYLADESAWPGPDFSWDGSATNVAFQVGEDTITVRIDRDQSAFDGAEEPADGSEHYVSGILSRFNDTPQLFGLFFEDDIVPYEAEGPVNVTFIANTSTVPDTLQSYHVLQVRGGASGPNSAGVEYPVTWDAASVSGENIGGDYWEFNFEMSPGDTLNYKLWAGFDTETGVYNGSEEGWESGGDRQFILAEDFSGDTTLTHWYETRTNPFEDKADSVGIKFRVNMGAQAQTGDFDPEVQQVGVRGSVNDWGDSFLVLEEEDPAGEGDNLFYSGILYVPDTLEAGESGEFLYKFVYEDGSTINWEDGDDKVGPLTKQDTTFQWNFFNNRRPTDAQIIDHTLQFEVDLAVLTGLGFFSSGYDSVFVRGIGGWDVEEEYMMTPAGVGSKYQLTTTVTEAVGATANYKYFVQYPDGRFDPDDENFFPGVDILEPGDQQDLGFEEPGVTGGGNRQYVFDDNTDAKLVGEHFFNGVPFAGLIADFNVDGGATEVTFSIDMTNATDSDFNEGTLFNPESDSVWIYFETKYFAFTQGVPPGTVGANAEQAERVRMTDEDGDMVYELTLSLNLPTINHMGFTIGYGSEFSETGDLTRNGGGFDAGRRYYQYLQPTEVFEIDDDGEIFLAGQYSSSYELPTLDWVAEDLPYEDMPAYDDISIDENISENPNKFALQQNYPNPFNPATTINFSLANTSNVKLAVYNILGQRVATLIDGRQMAAGTHSMSFDASQLASGTYIYRIEAGDFTSTKKMTLIK